MPKQLTATGEHTKNRCNSSHRTGQKLGDLIIDNDKFLEHILSIYDVDKSEYLISASNIKKNKENLAIVEYATHKGFDIVPYLFILNYQELFEIGKFIKYYNSMLKKTDICINNIRNYYELLNILDNELIIITFVIAIQYYFS